MKNIKYAAFVLFTKIVLRIKKFNLSLNLTELGKAYRTDKFELGYLPEYERFLMPIRKKARSILEIGIGAHNNTKSGGYSLKMWASYFKKAKIYGIDLIDKSFLNSRRISTFKCDQSNASDIKKKTKDLTFDLIIDDGSHFVEHQITSFQNLFPKLNPGGFYIIEDISGSFSKRLGGDPTLKEITTVSLFREKIYSCFSNAIINEQTNFEIDKNIQSIYFWGSKINDEGFILIQKSTNLGSSPTERNEEKKFLLSFDEYKAFNKKWNKSKSGVFITKP